jgi:galactokinase
MADGKWADLHARAWEMLMERVRAVPPSLNPHSNTAKVAISLLKQADAEIQRLRGVVADCQLEMVDAETDSAARSREQAREIQRLEAENERLKAALDAASLRAENMDTFGEGF